MTRSEQLRPFCSGDRAAERAFCGWLERLRVAGLEVSEPDRFVIGLVASRELKLEQLRRVLAKARDLGERLRIGEAERRAATDFRMALEFLERAVGERLDAGAVEEEQARPLAVAAGTKVLAMPARKHRAEVAAADRIRAVLGRAGRPLTKPELRRRVPGDAQAFLRALKNLHEAGEVTRKGRGVNRSPFRYEVGGAT